MKEALLIKLIDKLLNSENGETKSGLNDVFVGKYVLVRTYSAGVHFGRLESRCGSEVVLHKARRIWSWEGAFTLSKVASCGIGSGKLSVEVDEILLVEAIEIITLSEAAKTNLYEIAAHE